MGELIDELTKLNASTDEIRQAVLQGLSSIRSGQAGATGGAAGGSGQAPEGQTPAGTTGFKSTATKFAKALGGGAAGLGSFASSQLSSIIGGPAGALASSAFDLLAGGFGVIQRDINAAVQATPLFSNRSFVDQSAGFGQARGWIDFFGETLHGNMVTDRFVRERREIDEAQAHEQIPILRAADNLSHMARLIAEQGGEGYLSKIKELVPYEVERQRRGQNAEEIVHDWVTKFAGANPSASNQNRSQ
jgi:hypothetical protein